MAECRWIGGDGGGTTDPTIGANWSTAAVPADGDSIVFPATTAYSCLGYDATVGGTRQFIGFEIEDGYDGTIGTVGLTAGVNGPFAVDLKDDAAYYDARIAARGACNLSISNYQSLIITRAPSASAGEFGVNIVGIHDSAASDRGRIVIDCSSDTDSVGLGGYAGEDIEFNTLSVSRGAVTIGSSATLHDDATAISAEITGGIVVCKATLGVVTLEQNAGVFTFEDGPLTTGNIWGGTLYYNSDGTCTTMNVRGTVDCRGDTRAKTWTNTVVYQGGAIQDPNKDVTFTNGIDITGATLADVTLNLGTHWTLSRSVI